MPAVRMLCCASGRCLGLSLQAQLMLRLGLQGKGMTGMQVSLVQWQETADGSKGIQTNSTPIFISWHGGVKRP